MTQPIRSLSAFQATPPKTTLEVVVENTKKELLQYLGMTDDFSWSGSHFGLGFYTFPYTRTHYALITKLLNDEVSSLDELDQRLEAIPANKDGALRKHINLCKPFIALVIGTPNYTPEQLFVAALLNHLSSKKKNTPENTPECTAISQLINDLRQLVNVYGKIHQITKKPYFVKCMSHIKQCMQALYVEGQGNEWFKDNLLSALNNAQSHLKNSDEQSSVIELIKNMQQDQEISASAHVKLD